MSHVHQAVKLLHFNFWPFSLIANTKNSSISSKLINNKTTIITKTNYFTKIILHNKPELDTALSFPLFFFSYSIQYLAFTTSMNNMCHVLNVIIPCKFDPSISHWLHDNINQHEQYPQRIQSTANKVWCLEMTCLQCNLTKCPGSYFIQSIFLVTVWHSSAVSVHD